MDIEEDIKALNELYLHDMELLGIKINYFGRIVEVSLNDEQKNKHALLFGHMQNFSMTGFEQWGEGMYVSKVKVITSCIENIVKGTNDYVMNYNGFMTKTETERTYPTTEKRKKTIPMTRTTDCWN